MGKGRRGSGIAENNLFTLTLQRTREEKRRNRKEQEGRGEKLEKITYSRNVKIKSMYRNWVKGMEQLAIIIEKL